MPAPQEAQTASPASSVGPLTIRGAVIRAHPRIVIMPHHSIALLFIAGYLCVTAAEQTTETKGALAPGVKWRVTQPLLSA